MDLPRLSLFRASLRTHPVVKSRRKWTVLITENWTRPSVREWTSIERVLRDFLHPLLLLPRPTIVLTPTLTLTKSLTFLSVFCKNLRSSVGFVESRFMIKVEGITYNF